MLCREVGVVPGGGHTKKQKVKVELWEGNDYNLFFFMLK